MSVEEAQAVFRQPDPAVWLVTSRAGSRRGGLVATFVSQASIVPALPRVLIGLSARHHTRELVEEGGVFALHLLGEEHVPWVWKFGLESGRDVDKLEGLPAKDGATGCPILEGVPGWLDCRVETRLETGGHTVYLGEVVDASVAEADRRPLTIHRLLELAPTDKVDRLRGLIERDSAREAEAIEAWRQSRRA